MFRKLDKPDTIVNLTIDGAPVAAEPGESVAAVLMRQSDPCMRTTPISASPRAPYCMMGVCFDCLADVDGVGSVQTCLISVREGMSVARQPGIRKVAS